MGASQRNKGNQGEREWTALLRTHGWTDAQRLLGQARDGGGDVPLPPMLYEVKRYNKIAVRKWLDQACHSMIQYQGRGCNVPAVAMREDGRKDWMVLLRAEDFLALLRLTKG